MKEKPVYEGNHSRLWWWDCIFTRKIVSMLPAAVALSAGWRNAGLCIMKILCSTLEHLLARVIRWLSSVSAVTEDTAALSRPPRIVKLGNSLQSHVVAFLFQAERYWKNNPFRFLLCELFNKWLCQGKTKSVCFRCGAKGQEPLGMLKSESMTGRCSGY